MHKKPSDISEELEKLAPGLSSLLEDSARSVPEGYFPRLEATIQQRVRNGKVRSIRTYLYWAAAAILLVTVGTVFILNSRELTAPSFEKQLAALNEAELLTIIENEIDDLSAEELVLNGLVDDYSPLDDTQLLEAAYDAEDDIEAETTESDFFDNSLLDSLSETELLELLEDPFGI